MAKSCSKIFSYDLPKEIPSISVTHDNLLLSLSLDIQILHLPFPDHSKVCGVFLSLNLTKPHLTYIPGFPVYEFSYVIVPISEGGL